jgi:hypothetical protein
MKRFIVICLALCLPSAASAQTGNRKTIKDPAEYNAYITAFNTSDPAQKAAAMETFLANYPQSIMRTEALEQARAGYQATGNIPKVEEISRVLLKDNADDIQSLALLAAIDRNKGTPESVARARAEAEKGLQLLPAWHKPDGVSEEDFAKVTRQMRIVFNGAAGFGALQDKDYYSARIFLEAANRLDPADLQDVYQLAIASLQLEPPDIRGFWYCARAMHLARQQNNQAAITAMQDYCGQKYKRFHGSDVGWQQLVAAAAAQDVIPADFRVQEDPVRCAIAVRATEENQLNELSFSDKEFVLSKRDCSPANQRAAERVWQSILTLEKNGEVKLEIPVKVIRGSADSLLVAVSEDNQTSNQPDLLVVLASPGMAPPAPGSFVKVTGVIVSYTPMPFQFRMERAAVNRATTTPSKD